MLQLMSPNTRSMYSAKFTVKKKDKIVPNVCLLQIFLFTCFHWNGVKTARNKQPQYTTSGSQLDSNYLFITITWTRVQNLDRQECDTSIILINWTGVGPVYVDTEYNREARHDLWYGWIIVAKCSGWGTTFWQKRMIYHLLLCSTKKTTWWMEMLQV